MNTNFYHHPDLKNLSQQLISIDNNIKPNSIIERKKEIDQIIDRLAKIEQKSSNNQQFRKELISLVKQLETTYSKLNQTEKSGTDTDKIKQMATSSWLGTFSLKKKKEKAIDTSLQEVKKLLTAKWLVLFSDDQKPKTALSESKFKTQWEEGVKKAKQIGHGLRYETNDQKLKQLVESYWCELATLKIDGKTHHISMPILAPFMEEWKTSQSKLSFEDFMQEKILTFSPDQIKTLKDNSVIQLGHRKNPGLTFSLKDQMYHIPLSSLKPYIQEWKTKGSSTLENEELTFEEFMQNRISTLSEEELAHLNSEMIKEPELYTDKSKEIPKDLEECEMTFDPFRNIRRGGGKVADGEYIFVLGQDRKGQKMYISNKIRGKIQHSSFFHGKAVLAAGTIKIKEGKLVELKPMSGHYQPTKEYLLQTKNFIKKKLSREAKEILPEDQEKLLQAIKIQEIPKSALKIFEKAQKFYFTYLKKQQ